MSGLSQQIQFSEQQYLADEALRETKHQLINGQIVAMAGGSVNHERIARNLIVAFSHHLDDSPCEPFGSDMKVKANSNFFYPDVTVVCDFDESQPVYTEKPTIIIEVLSKSTRRIDETTKRANYINIPSLQEYVLIEQDFVDVEIIRRSNGWQSEHFFMGDKVTFESVDLTLSVEAIYRRVKNQDVEEYLASL